MMRTDPPRRFSREFPWSSPPVHHSVAARLMSLNALYATALQLRDRLELPENIVAPLDGLKNPCPFPFRL